MTVNNHVFTWRDTADSGHGDIVISCGYFLTTDSVSRGPSLAGARGKSVECTLAGSGLIGVIQGFRQVGLHNNPHEGKLKVASPVSASTVNQPSLNNLGLSK